MNNLASLISETLIRYPQNILLADTDHAWTGSQIENKIAEIEKYLQVSTIENSLVGICFPNLAYQGLAILATLKAKRVPVILSYADLFQQPKVWLDRVPLDFLLTTIEFEPISYSYVTTLALTVAGDISYEKRNSPTLNLVVKAPEGTGLVLYTSGSTGVPKGICVPAAGIEMTCEYLSRYFGLNAETVTPIVLPVCHSMALNTQFLPTFFNGGKSFFLNSRLVMNKLFRHIDSMEGTFVSLIGEVLRICWEEMNHKKLHPNLRVNHVQLAGGMISEKHLQMAADLFPNALIHKGYGLTEAIRVTMIDHHDPLFLENVVGHTLPFQETEIRLPHGELAEMGEMGEIFVKGPNVMLGILGHEFSPVGDDGFLSTGDLGSINEKGQLSIFGRKDSVFKINGLKVSGLEIENIASSVSTYVREAKCILVEDHRKVKNKIILFLEISTDRQHEFFQNYFEIFHQALWAEFKNLSYFPKDIIITPKFPRTNNGKLAITGLQELWKKQNREKLAQESHGSFLFYKSDELVLEDLKEML